MSQRLPAAGDDQGPALAERAFAAFAVQDRLALARAALPRLFDHQTFDDVLRGAAAGLEQLVALGGLERLPGGDEKFRVPDALRPVAWRAWAVDRYESVVPLALLAFADLFAAHAEQRGLTVERLRALVLVDERQAAQAFRTEFDACADRMDLAGCRNLLEVLTDPMLRPMVGQRLTALRNDRSRALYARDVLRSSFLLAAHYLHRPELEAVLERLLSDQPPHALRLQGSGGNGKSTLLRWFVSRRCVPDGIPCALIDLDVVDPVNATRHPFLVALEIAYQLNGQMEGAPFEDLLREHGSYRRLLTRRSDRATTAALGTVSSDVDAEDVVFRLLSVLAEVAAARPVLVVVDTFEEAALRPAGDADRLADLLGDVMATSVRLVLSGRHTRAEDSMAAFARRTTAQQMPFCQVDCFTDAESKEYLRSTRDIARPDLISAIVRRVDGVPWQLAIYADVVDRHPDIDAEALRTLDPGVAWAVDRIVGRIDDDVLQWVLRYGSVPRRLSRGFVEDVLLGRIADAMAGGEEDRPSRDPVPPDSVPVFRTGAVPPTAYDGVWERLIRYEAKTSWLWTVPMPWQAVEFDRPLREAMRRLVDAQPIGVRLHRDAMDYYERKAAEQPDLWVTWIVEALYLRFRVDGVGAAGHWQAAVRHAWSLARPDWVAAVAEELLGPDYLDDDGAPVAVLAGLPAMDDELLRRSHVERAWALAVWAREQSLPGEDATWSRVETSVNAALRLPATADSQARHTAARAALLLARGDAVTAAGLLAGIDTSTFVPAERVPVRVLHADALGASGDLPGRRETLMSALELTTGIPTAEVIAQLARHDLDAGRVDVAAGWIASVSDDAESSTVPTVWATTESLALSRVRIAMDSGQPSTALALAETADLVAEQVRALTMLGRAAEAVVRCSRELAGTLALAETADLLVLRALAYAELLDVDRALDDLLQARSVRFELADNEGAGMTCVHAARVQLRVVGNLRDAEHLLEEADRLRLAPSGPAWTQAALVHMELRSRVGDDAAASAIADELLGSLDRTARPHDVATVVLAVLVAIPVPRDDLLDLVADTLAEITPASARLAVLSAVEHADVAPWVSKLAALATQVGEQDGDHVDRAWLDLREAHLHRLAGRGQEAYELASAATAVLGELSDLPRWWLLDLMRRCRPPRTEAAADLWVPDFPLLTAATILTWADLSIDVASPEALHRKLDAAAQAIGEGTQRSTRWRWLLYDVRRRLAEPTGDEELADYYRIRALGVQIDLGELVQDLSADLASDQHRARPEVRLQATIDTTGSLVVSADGRELLRLGRHHPLVAALGEESDRRTKSPVVSQSWQAVRRRSFLDLARPLPMGDGEDPVDLRISAEPPLAQLPWELLTYQDVPIAELPRIRVVYRGQGALRDEQVRVRVLQEALAEAGPEFDPGPLDGYLGGLTRGALTRLQNDADLTVDGVAGPLTWQALRDRATAHRPPTVVVTQRDPETEWESHRGYSHVGADDLVQVYHRFGWRVHVVPADALRRIEEFVPDKAVDVLHVNASMDVSGAVPYLDFGASTRGWSQERYEEVPVSDLDFALYCLSLRRHTPMVVLDIAAAPQFTSETVRQLLLRNEYAYQLLGLGKAHSVLATGLATEQQAATAQVELVDALGRPGATPADVIQRLYRRSSDHIRRTSLFTTLRPDLMPAVTPAAGR